MISSYTTGLRLMSEGRDFRGRLWLAFFAALLLACLAKRDTLLWVEEGRDDEMQIIKNTGAALSLGNVPCPDRYRWRKGGGRGGEEDESSGGFHGGTTDRRYYYLTLRGGGELRSETCTKKKSRLLALRCASVGEMVMSPRRPSQTPTSSPVSNT